MRNLSKARAVVQIVFAALVCFFVGWTVYRNWADFRTSIATMEPGWLVAAVLAGVVAVLLSMLSWRSTAAALGHHVRIPDAARVVLISQIGKYLPGGVWPVVVGTRLGMRAGVPGVHMALSLTAQLVVGVVSAGVLGLGSLLSFPELADRFGWIVGLGIVAGLVLLLPSVLTRVLELLLRLRGRGAQGVRVRPAPLARAAAWSFASWIAFGLHLWFVLEALSPQDLVTMPLAVSAFALAWVAGFLVVVTPAGAGIRELVLALALAGTVGEEDILGVVLVSRLALVLVDVALCVAAWASTPRGARGEPVAVDR